MSEPVHIFTPADLAATLRERGIAAELIKDIGETPTVPAAAAALGVSTDQIIKTLLFFIAGEPYAVITNGTAPVPVRSLADLFKVGKRQIKLAKADEVIAITGYPAGGVPPFGHRTPVPILLDRTVLAWDVIYGGGGDDRTLMRLTTAELLAVTGAQVVDLTS